MEFDEVAEDLVHLNGSHDDGEDLHPAAALHTVKRIHFIDLGDQPCPCGGCGLTCYFPAASVDDVALRAGEETPTYWNNVGSDRLLADLLMLTEIV